jgi:hypothetical protein
MYQHIYMKYTQTHIKYIINQFKYAYDWAGYDETLGSAVEMTLNLMQCLEEILLIELIVFRC